MSVKPLLGLESGVVRVVPYNAKWPELFRIEAERLSSTLAPLGVTLEHTGSTSVPGLAAKPILDILAGYDDRSLLPKIIAALVDAGYIHRGEQGIAGREFFRRGDPRSHHIHLAQRNGTFWNDHLKFRDALRADDKLRDEYAALKTQLAQRFPRNREAYIEAKTEFVCEVISRAY